MKFLKWTVLSILLAGVTVSCSEDDDDNNDDNQPKQQTIAATVQASEDFSILEDALVRTQLVGVLDDANAEFTVFAPDNAAFQDLLSDLGYSSLDELENALGTSTLANILLYHVIGAEVMASDVNTGYVTTQGTNGNNNNLSAYISTAGGVTLNGVASVEQTDIDASNGVIHRINAVILPMSVAGLVAVNDETFTSLEAALGVADGGLVAVLSDESSEFTVFAPTDAAFTELINETNSGDLNGLVQYLGGTDELANVLTYHVLPSEVQSGDVPNGDVATVNGANITLSTASGVTVTDAQGGTAAVTLANITGTNGVIHRINAVLLP